MTKPNIAKLDTHGLPEVHLGFILQGAPGEQLMVETMGKQILRGELSIQFNARQVWAALDIAPLKCAYLVDPDQAACIIGIFPAPEQQAIFNEIALEGSRVVLRSGQAQLEINQGTVKLHAQDVGLVSDGELRIAGIRVRMN